MQTYPQGVIRDRSRTGRLRRYRIGTPVNRLNGPAKFAVPFAPMTGSRADVKPQVARWGQIATTVNTKPLAGRWR